MGNKPTSQHVASKSQVVAVANLFLHNGRRYRQRRKIAPHRHTAGAEQAVHKLGPTYMMFLVTVYTCHDELKGYLLTT